MIEQRIKLFAAARDSAGADELRIELDHPATLGELRRQLARQHPQLAPLLPHCLFSVDRQYADDQTPLPERAEIACIPPVSGG